MLQQLLAGHDETSELHFSEAVDGDGARVFAMAERMGLEGIVSKRPGSRYTSGPTKQWLKTKCMTESDLVVVGVEPNPGAAPFALLAREAGGGLVYVGSAWVNLPEPERSAFWERADTLKILKPVVPEIRRNKAGFLKPEMRVRIRHLRGGGMLRHGSVRAVL